MKKINFRAGTILNKKFGVELAGYDAAEVDAYLDQVIEDYALYEQMADDQAQLVSDHQRELQTKVGEITKLQMEIAALHEQLRKIGRANNAALYEELSAFKERLRNQGGNEDHATLLKEIETMEAKFSK